MKAAKLVVSANVDGFCYSASDYGLRGWIMLIIVYMDDVYNSLLKNDTNGR